MGEWTDLSGRGDASASRTSKGAGWVPDTKAQERSRRHADAAAPLLGDGGRGGNARGGWAAGGLWTSVGGLIFFVSFFANSLFSFSSLQ